MNIMANTSRLRIWAGGFLCGAIAAAAIVLVARTFFISGLVAKVETSSGSMAPWLIGPHGEATCEICGTPFVFDALFSPERLMLDCPNCGQRMALVRSTETIAGEQVLIDRRAYSARAPRRWEPVVFACPHEQDTVCVKRVVGLPGETVEVRAGDVYIDGRIARKSLDEQLDVAILVHDNAHRTLDAGSRASGWAAIGTNADWELSPDKFHFDSTNDALSALRFQSFRRNQPMPILDDYAYNQRLTRQLNEVHDLMLAFDLTMRGSGSLRIVAHAHGHHFEAVFECEPQSTASLWLDSAEVETAEVETADLPENFAQPVGVVFSLFDRQALFAINGQTLLRYELDSQHNQDKQRSREKLPPASLAIHARDVVAQLSHVRLSRDIFYTLPRTARWGSGEPRRLAADEFFVLGDNSPISDDSRHWKAPGLASSRIVGKPLRIER